MRTLYFVLRNIVLGIAMLIFAAGIGIALLGVYDFIHVLSYLSLDKKDGFIGLVAVGLLQAVDLFLVAIVMFVFSLGILILFNNKEELPVKLPEWLKVKDFMQLKIILWEAILTTLVVSYLAGLVQMKINNVEITVSTLVIPGGILLIALSLFFLKRGEH